MPDAPSYSPSTPETSNAPEIKALRKADGPRVLAAAWWDRMGRADQKPPESDDWSTWVFLGGRGAGKTRAGAEWLRGAVAAGRAHAIALLGPTLHDVREVMIDGPSGLRAIDPDRPVYESSRRRLLWPSGAVAHAFSAEDPDSLRGPQFDHAWADEFCAWRDPEAALATLRPALRLGPRPRLAVTTTPRPSPALLALLAERGTVRTHAATAANAANLAPGFLEALDALWAGTARARQELDGEILADLPGALWRRDMIRRAAADEVRACGRILVAVDPPAGEGPRADACGIVAVGALGEGRARRAVVLADASVRGLSPQGWSRRAAALARSLGAEAIVVEANQGGAMARTVLELAAPGAPVRLVYAGRSKRARAEPVAALYEQGRVSHARAFAALEDEMCAFGAQTARGSPDRVDALVWAVSSLLLADAEPRLRSL